jgi:NAD(P)-dependent dehydrogenase (short-subunit alcohol dehydrogenase family)
VAVRFDGKVALVAGGTGALGREVTIALLREGAQVTVTWQQENELGALKSEAGAHLAQLEASRVDITDAAAVDRLIDGIAASKGRLDILINTAGGFAGGTKIWESDPAALDRMLALNLYPGFLLSRAAVKVMLRRGSGAIVNLAAKAALDHPAGLAAYSASKAAALAMTGSLAEDLKGTGIRANSILPGVIDTEANRRAMPHADFTKWPKPGDIANVILFLVSDEAKVIHGASIPVYGSS